MSLGEAIYDHCPDGMTLADWTHGMSNDTVVVNVSRMYVNLDYYTLDETVALLKEVVDRIPSSYPAMFARLEREGRFEAKAAQLEERRGLVASSDN